MITVTSPHLRIVTLHYSDNPNPVTKASGYPVPISRLFAKEGNSSLHQKVRAVCAGGTKNPDIPLVCNDTYSSHELSLSISML